MTNGAGTRCAGRGGPDRARPSVRLVRPRDQARAWTRPGWSEAWSRRAGPAVRLGPGSWTSSDQLWTYGRSSYRIGGYLHFARGSLQVCSVVVLTTFRDGDRVDRSCAMVHRRAWFSSRRFIELLRATPDQGLRGPGRAGLVVQPRFVIETDDYRLGCRVVGNGWSGPVAGVGVAMPTSAASR